MSLTIAQRLERLKVYSGQYIALDRIPDTFQIKLIERSRDHVFRAIIGERDFLFRTTATVADGDAWPADFISYSNNAYYVLSGANIPFRYITVRKIGSALKNKYALATATNPAIAFFDRKVHTYPAGISGVTMEYIKRPTALDGAVVTTQDEMPEDTEDLIVRGAFERLLSQLVSDEQMLKIVNMTKEYVQMATQRYYLDYYRKNVLAGGEISIIAEETTI